MVGNHGLRRPVSNVYRILCSEMRGIPVNLSDLTAASSRYDILLFSETLITDMHHMLRLLVPGFGGPVLCRCKMPLVRGHTYEMHTEHF